MKMKVLFLPDYARSAVKLGWMSQLTMQLRRWFPEWHLQVAAAEGPYEDDAGDGAHYAPGKQRLNEKKLVLEVKKDTFVSVVKVLRALQLHRPSLLLGYGQGGAIAWCLKHPLVVEAALAARVVQPEEAAQLVQAWNKLDLLVAWRPGLGKVKPGLDLLVGGMGALVGEFPVGSLLTYVVAEKSFAHRAEVEAWCERQQQLCCKALEDVPWLSVAWMARPPLWEHSGQCSCGRRTYLFSECPECLPTSPSRAET